MTKTLTLALTLIAALPATSAHADTIDFDSLASGTALSNQFAGVLFSASEDGGAVSSIVTAGSNYGVPDSPPNNAANFWANTSVTSFVDRWDVLRVTFDSLASNVSWYTGTFGAEPVTFNAYDSGGILLETVVSGTSGQGDPFVSTSFSVAGISYFEGLQPNDNWGWGLDNLSYSPVPEPATLLLLGGGLTAAAARRRVARRA